MSASPKSVSGENLNMSERATFFNEPLYTRDPDIGNALAEFRYANYESGKIPNAQPIFNVGAASAIAGEKQAAYNKYLKLKEAKRKAKAAAAKAEYNAREKQMMSGPSQGGGRRRSTRRRATHRSRATRRTRNR